MSERSKASRPFSNSAHYRQAAGAIANGARVEKINSYAKDFQKDGDRGVVVASIGPITSVPTGESFHGYWIAWDDRPEVPFFITGDRIREVE